MSISKQFHLQFSQSPRSINKTSLKYDLALLGQSERLIKQPQIAPQKRQRSIIKQQLFLKTQISNSSLNKSNEDFLLKKQSQNQTSFQEQLIMKDLIIQEYEKKYRDQISVCQQLSCQVEQQKELIDQLQLQINHLKLYNLDLKKQVENSVLHQQCNQKQQEYKDQLRRFDEILRQTMDQNYTTQQKIKDFELKSQKLKQQSNDLKYHIICRNCNAQIKNAVTLIPCAHTFCNRCISNFKGQCFVCLDQSKVTATYANDYITDLAQIYQTLESLIGVIQ
ncbi:unnamed protein product [Paramecium octaurelia]|uniref:RING-type domain-containing protein n=1 Tax=Paramecium octaurelia TaxID=43137 RepID=A0A8S1X235_PAROT|nr:unnamed protein product [Paramecium octaurelia]